MAIVKKRSLREVDEKELEKKLNELKLELAKERASAFVGMPKNPGKIREIKKTISRIINVQKKKIEK
ncbi:MAG: 50S ribosomal protein L29 [Candidatus Aenigmatarchaeota archaeon]